MFFQYGIKAVSIDDIAHELGMSKKTIYNFFGSKDEIIDHILDRNIEEYTCSYSGLVSQSKNAIDAIVHIYRMKCEQHDLIKPIFISDVQKYYPRVWEKLKGFYEIHILKTIQENIQRGQQEGLYRENINTDFVSYLYYKNIFSLIDYFSSQKKYSILELDKEYIYYHIHAIGTPKGIKYLDKINLE